MKYRIMAAIVALVFTITGGPPAYADPDPPVESNLYLCLWQTGEPPVMCTCVEMYVASVQNREAICEKTEEPDESKPCWRISESARLKRGFDYDCTDDGEEQEVANPNASALGTTVTVEWRQPRCARVWPATCEIDGYLVQVSQAFYPFANLWQQPSRYTTLVQFSNMAPGSYIARVQPTYFALCEDENTCNMRPDGTYIWAGPWSDWMGLTVFEQGGV